MDITLLTASASIISAAGVLYTLGSKRKRARAEELHESLVIWVNNGGGKAIREIVNSENQVILQRFDMHEATEPLRFREYIEAALGKR